MAKSKKSIEEIIDELEKSANEAWAKNLEEHPDIYSSSYKYAFVYGWVTQGIKSHFKNHSL